MPPTYSRANAGRVRRLFADIKDRAPRDTEPSLDDLADLLSAALAHQPSRRLVLLSIADFMAQSMSGSVPDRWQPPSF